MNCPSRTDEPDIRGGWNQSPHPLALTTKEDFNGRTNAVAHGSADTNQVIDEITRDGPIDNPPPKLPDADMKQLDGTHVTFPTAGGEGGGRNGGGGNDKPTFFQKAKKFAVTYGSFIGPGFMVSVAYIDPGNYSTAVAAGASYQFRLLFIVLVSNIIAIYLQSLCIKLGTVTGKDLAQNCRAHLPKWLNIFLYVMAEGAIIATDIAEVIGTAIALNLLIPKLPLVAGCAISIVDVLLILIFYRPNGTMNGLRIFEFFVMGLVLAVVICFCIQLSMIENTTKVATVFRGYLPSKELVESNAIYQACGILGATVMPHSLYLGSGIVQPRLFHYDLRHHNVAVRPPQTSSKPLYQPSLAAIKFCLNFSIAELAISLFSFALFVNSAILIVAGAALYGVDGAEEASLFSIHDLLASTIAPAAGTIFALALLFSGISAGIVCTIAGQMVSEGALNWTIAPWMRRLITRSISITPSIIIAAAVGKNGLTAALNGSQVALCVALPFITAPLIYFTCREKFMTVFANRPTMLEEDTDSEDDLSVVSPSTSAVPLPSGVVTASVNAAAVEESKTGNAAVSTAAPPAATLSSSTALNTSYGVPSQSVEAGNARDTTGDVSFRNNWVSAVFAVAIWLLICVMNVTNLVLVGLDK